MACDSSFSYTTLDVCNMACDCYFSMYAKLCHHSSTMPCFSVSARHSLAAIAVDNDRSGEGQVLSVC